jgi:predicted RNA-binding Zn ribbon-like protein
MMVTTKDLRRGGFPFRSGTLCLDFVATLAKRGMGDRELLVGPAEFATWLRAAELPATPDPVTQDDVERTGTPASLMSPDGRSRLASAAAPLAEILAIVARDTVELFTGRYGNRIRACIGHDCSLFFVDRSRPGSRRWCAMAACGEKASSATYRQRHTGNAQG